MDPYVGPPTEPAATPRLARLRVWLVLAIAILLLSSWGGMQLITARQDPTLQVPGDAPAGQVDPAPADPAGGIDVPTAPTATE